MSNKNLLKNFHSVDLNPVVFIFGRKSSLALKGVYVKMYVYEMLRKCEDALCKATAQKAFSKLNYYFRSFSSVTSVTSLPPKLIYVVPHGCSKIATARYDLAMKNLLRKPGNERCGIFENVCIFSRHNTFQNVCIFFTRKRVGKVYAQTDTFRYLRYFVTLAKSRLEHPCGIRNLRVEVTR